MAKAAPPTHPAAQAAKQVAQHHVQGMPATQRQQMAGKTASTGQESTMPGAKC